MIWKYIYPCIMQEMKSQTDWSNEEGGGVMQEVFEKIVEELEIERTIANNTFVKYEMNVDLGRVFGLEKAIEIVKQAVEEYNNGWIPVSESLPEEKINPITDDFYIYPVMYKDGDVTDIKYFHFGYGHWHHGFEIVDDYVTHWMDIKPYQPKGE